MQTSRIKPVDAMKYLGLKRESFLNWCVKVGLTAYNYEFSNRQYYLSGEFYAKADYNTIIKIKEIHGDGWQNFYPKAVEVTPFLPSEIQKDEIHAAYEPKSKDVLDFKKKLFNEKS